MQQDQIEEILAFINDRYEKNVPRAVRMLAKGKIKKIENMEISALPDSLQNCTINELLQIIQAGIKDKKLKI